MDTPFRPLRDNLLIKPDEYSKTAGKLHLVEEKVPPWNFGTVVASGPGAVVDGRTLPMSVHIGDRVLYGAYGPTRIKLNDEELLVCSAEHLLAVEE
jgi:chaperonin GroES